MAKVLVIDDDPSLLRALRLGLQAGGHDVVTAANGEQGISQTALTSPDVVVLDLGLPDLDGQTVCRRIRQWSEVPIIILSASGTEDRKVAALDGGADDYVTSPSAWPSSRPGSAPPSATGTPSRPTSRRRRSPSGRSSSTSSTTRPPRGALGRPDGQGVRRARPSWPAMPGGPAPTR